MCNSPRSVSRHEPTLEKTRCLVRQFSNVRRAVPVLVSHSRTVSSYDADATILLSGEKATVRIFFIWPLSVCRAAPVFISHNCSVLSYDADIILLSSGEKATILITSVWPSNVCKAVPVFISHSCIVLWYNTDAAVLPS